MDILFQQVRIFTGLNSKALKFLADHAQELHFNALDVVVQEGDLGDRLFIVQQGEVRACRNFAKPGEKELARLTSGECFGEMCILDTLPRSATIQAIRNSQLFSIDTITLYEFHLHHPSQFSVLLINLARELSSRLRELDKAFAALH